MPAMMADKPTSGIAAALAQATSRASTALIARADAVDLVQGETEVIPGLSLIPAPGHTLAIAL